MNKDTLLKPEEWRDIPGYENYYQVSSFGRVKSLSRRIFGGILHARRIKERIMKFAKTDRGYLMVSLSKEGVANSFRVHRLVIVAFKVAIPAGLECNHKDGNKQNNRIDNLELVTHRENCLHKYHVLGHKMPGQGLGALNGAAKKVKCIETGEVFDTVTLAEQKYFMSSGEIAKAATNYRGRKTAKGLHWEYITGLKAKEV